MRDKRKQEGRGVKFDSSLAAIAANLDLIVDRGLKCNPHFADRHVVSMKELKRRLHSPQNNGRPVGTFETLADARKYAKATIRHHIAEVDFWLRDAYVGERITLDWVFREVVGYGFFVQDESVAYGTKKCRVVLQKNNNAYEFNVVTTFPMMDWNHRIDI